MSLRPTELDTVTRARILIVEDEGIVAKDLVHSLRALGYSVCGTSASGAEAVTKADQLRPDLILMDVRLRGGMDGIEATRVIRTRLDIPVVFLTAYADPDTLNRATEVGPYGYVLKPFDDRELQVALIMAMCKHRAFAELDHRVQERTAELARSEARYKRLSSLAELGLFALANPDTDTVMQRAVSLVAETLEVDLVSILELEADGAALHLRAGVGWAEGSIGSARVEAAATSHSGYTLRAQEPIMMVDVRHETRFQPSRMLTDHGVLSGISAVIHAPGPAGQPHGILGAYCRRPRPYSEADVHFLQAAGNVIATAIMRASADSKVVAAERASEEQRTRAAVAEEALRAREEFLSVAAHELRTPVAALQLQIEALQVLLAPFAPQLDARFAERMARATKTVTRLAKLVEGVLDISRIALGNLQLEREPLELGELLREVAARHDELAGRAGCDLRLDVSDSLSGRWDRVRIEQVITNLLSNAIKFGAGRPVEVSLARRGHEAVLTVRDHGPGIHPDDAQRILQRFERAVSACHYGGLGLGLYIAGQIVSAHGGRIDVRSAPGEGAALAITLPCD